MSQMPLILLLVIITVLPTFASPATKTAQYYVDQSDWIVVATVTNTELDRDFDGGSVDAICLIKVSEYLFKRGKKIAPLPTGIFPDSAGKSAVVIRLPRMVNEGETEDDMKLPDAVKKGAKCIFFLKRQSAGDNVLPVISDPWFGIVPFRSFKAEGIRRVARTEREDATKREPSAGRN